MTGPMRRVPAPLQVVTAATACLVILSGCASAASRASGESAGGPSVPHGADAQQWQAAFEEIDGTYDLVWQTANAATSSTGERVKQFEQRIEEYSGGKVQVEVAYQDTISGTPQEADEALQDGRIDMHLLVPFQQPSDYPVSGDLMVNSSLARDTSYLADYVASIGATNEVWWDVPELHDEYEAVGLTVLAPMPVIPQTSLACREPLTSLDDLRGKQIRVGPSGAFGQIEALGATPVSVVYADLFEALQRGIVDCMVIGTITMADIPGMTELAPYIIHPSGTNFVTTPGTDLAGANWRDWPLTVQQLVYDMYTDYELDSITDTINRGLVQHDLATAAGGGYLELEDDANEALLDYNQGVIDTWRSTDLLADGDAYVDSLGESLETWTQLVDEIGFSDAPLVDVEEWSRSKPDWKAFNELYYERVHLPHRPS